MLVLLRKDVPTGRRTPGSLAMVSEMHRIGQDLGVFVLYRIHYPCL